MQVLDVEVGALRILHILDSIQEKTLLVNKLDLHSFFRRADNLNAVQVQATVYHAVVVQICDYIE